MGSVSKANWKIITDTESSVHCRDTPSVQTIDDSWAGFNSDIKFPEPELHTSSLQEDN